MCNKLENKEGEATLREENRVRKEEHSIQNGAAVQKSHRAREISLSKVPAGQA